MKIARIPRMTYTPGKLEYSAFIRAGAGADYHQNPEFHQHSNGDLVMWWHAYDFDECSNHGIKLFSTSKDRGLTWTDPQVFMADYPGGIPYYILMRRLRGTKTVLMIVNKTFHHEIEVDESRNIATAGSDYFKSKTRTYVRRSTDDGRSFDNGTEIPYLDMSGGKELPVVGFYGSVDNFIQLQSGRLLAAFTFMDPARSDFAAQRQHITGACMISDDQGVTWKRSTEIHADTPRGVMEPQIAEVAPNQLYCLFRTAGGYLYETSSTDGGATWAPTKPSPLPAPESMPRMIKLQSGALLTVWNNVSSTTQWPRHPLAASLSDDGGRTWGPHRIIAIESGMNQLSNHNIIQLDDGRILVCTSRYHAVSPMTSDLDLAILDEAWLRRG